MTPKSAEIGVVQNVEEFAAHSVVQRSQLAKKWVWSLTTAPPILDAMQEFRIMSNNYAAEYGHSTA